MLRSRSVACLALLAAFITCASDGRSRPVGTQENGIPANILSNLAAVSNIASSTNTTPIVITTSTPHGMTNGDRVSINAHAVNTAANGDWDTIVLSATTFSITGSVGTAAGGATGTVQPRSIGPTFTIPSDGVDNEAATSVNVPFDALADRTAFVAAAGLGSRRISLVGTYQNDDDTNALWDQFPVTQNVWNDLTGNTVWQPFLFTGPGVHTGDLIQIDAQFQQIVTSSANIAICQLQLWYAVQPPGGTMTMVKLPASSSGALVVPVTTTLYAAPHLQGLITAPNAGVLNVKIKARAQSAGAITSWQMIGDYSVRATILRPTGFPQ